VQAHFLKEHGGLVGGNWLISSSMRAEITTVAAPCAAAISATRADWLLPLAALASSTLQT
jgi:hypothetical protein